MNKKRKIEIAGGKISFQESEEMDLNYWLSISWQQRLIEVEALRKSIWTKLTGKYPKRIKKTGGKKLFKNQDEDDF